MQTNFKTSKFTFDVEEKELSATASAMGWPIGQWPDSLWVRSEHTGARLTFSYKVEHVNEKDELVYMSYQSMGTDTTLIIYND